MALNQKEGDVSDLLSEMENKFESSFNVGEKQVQEPQKRIEKNETAQQFPQSQEKNLPKESSNINLTKQQQSLEISYSAVSTEQKNQGDSFNSPLKAGESNPHLVSQEMISNSQSDQKEEIPSTSILDYRELQDKIETALKKSNKYREMTSATSRYSSYSINNGHSAKMTQSTSDLMFARFTEYERKKEREIQRKKKEQQDQQVEGLDFTPKINKKSEKILQQMGSHSPIFERFESLIEAKNKSLKEKQDRQILKEQQKYAEYLQEFKKHNKVPEEIRSFDDFFEEMIKWKKHSQNNLQEKKKQLHQREMQKAHFHQPHINKNSQKIIAQKGNRTPISDRQIPSQKKYKSKIDEECTFHPKINKKRQK